MPFAAVSEDAAVFLGELAQGKNRAWFEAHRAESGRVLIEPAQELRFVTVPSLSCHTSHSQHEYGHMSHG